MSLPGPSPATPTSSVDAAHLLWDYIRWRIQDGSLSLPPSWEPAGHRTWLFLCLIWFCLWFSLFLIKKSWLLWMFTVNPAFFVVLLNKLAVSQALHIWNKNDSAVQGWRKKCRGQRWIESSDMVRRSYTLSHITCGHSGKHQSVQSALIKICLK